MLPIETARYLFSLQNPFPPVDRRYRLAKIYLAHGAKPSLRRDDEYTWEIYRYLRARVALREPKARVNDVLQKYPDLDCAVKSTTGGPRPCDRSSKPTCWPGKTTPRSPRRYG